MEFVSQLEADALLAMHTPTQREEFIAKIRSTFAESGQEGPCAAVFTMDELVAEGFGPKEGSKRGGSGIKAGRNGQGHVSLVRTLDDGRILIVLRPEAEVEAVAKAAAKAKAKA